MDSVYSVKYKFTDLDVLPEHEDWQLEIINLIH